MELSGEKNVHKRQSKLISIHENGGKISNVLIKFHDKKIDAVSA